MRDDRPSPAELDALEQRALAEWLGTSDRLDDEDDGDLPGGVSAGFAERVLAAESSVLPVPVIVPIDAGPGPRLDDITGMPRPSAPRRRWGTLVGSFALAAGLGGLWLAQRPPSVREEVDTKIGSVDTETIATVRPAAPIPDDLDEQVASYIADYGRHFGPTFEFHGAILVARDGKVHYAQGFGVADPAHDTANTPQTRFRIGMLTEQFTAAAILQLRDAGMLQLDDPVSEHLPGFPNGRSITIMQLLQHSSGIPNYTDLPNFHEWKLRPHTSEQLIGRFSELPLEFKPGEDFTPTNSGYFLLGAIIEKKSGMSYGEYMQRYVFEPLGMRDTMVGDEYGRPGQARGNVWNEEEQLDPPDPIDMSVFGAAGGIVSSIEDLAKWDSALYEGRILARSSVEQMIEPNRFGYGFGWVVGEDQDQTVVSFPGAIDGFNSAIMRYTADRTLVVVLCNTEIVPAGRIASDIAMMVYGGHPPPRIEYPEVQVAPGTFSRYLGSYGITDDTIRVLGAGVDESMFEPLQTVHVKQIGDRLYFDVPAHGSTWMHPMGRHRFFFKDNSGNYINFTLDAEGDATGLVVHYPDAELELQRKGE
ncbi:MAG TPA: serine hydrolase domain-containing protein [Nannocystaceae bacterium]|nr:serine hydrolase domain-containing protein [Nannocystaceae bacterium]